MKEHDDTLIKNWNDLISNNDQVFHLGDFSWRNPAAYIDKLNGKIYYIKGNHDKMINTIRQRFLWYGDVRYIHIGDYSFWLSHYAHRVWNKSHYGTIHLYGHSHGTLPDDPNVLSMDVGVDNAFKLLGAYRPFTLNEVLEFMKKKNFKPVDHHTQKFRLDHTASEQA